MVADNVAIGLIVVASVAAVGTLALCARNIVLGLQANRMSIARQVIVVDYESATSSYENFAQYAVTPVAPEVEAQAKVDTNVAVTDVKSDGSASHCEGHELSEVSKK